MVRKVEFMLADSFEVTGEWWLPEKPEARIYGTLRYSHTDIELELSREFDDAPMTGVLSDSKFKNYPCILGCSYERQKFTLLRTHAFSLGTTTKYKAVHIIADKHVAALPELKLRSVSFHCQHLDTFIARGLFTMENEGQLEDFRSCTVKYHQPDKLTWRIDEIGACLDFQASLDWSCNSYEQWHKLHARSFVTITPDTPQCLDWFIRHTWRFCYLLTFVTDEIVSPTGVEVFLEGDKYPGWHLYEAGKEREVDEKATPIAYLRSCKRLLAA